nr:C25 family cysteine peptidase [uncultured Desulfobacter sp.]
MNLKIIILVCLLFVFVSSVDAQGQSFSRSITSKDSDFFEMVVTLPELIVEDFGKDVSGREITRIYMPDVPSTSHVGLPKVPVVSVKIAIPVNSEIAAINVESRNNTILEGSYFLELSTPPVQLNNNYTILDDSDSSLYDSFYSDNNAYESAIYEKQGIQNKRGIKILHINLYPVSYDIDNLSLSYCDTMIVKITFSSIKQQSSKFQSNSAVKYRPDPVMPIKNQIDNPWVLDELDESSEIESKSTDSSETFEYVIITNNDFANATTDYTIHDLIAHKQLMGLSATYITTEQIYANYTGSDEAEKIRNFIKDAYNNWNTNYILLAGDSNIIPYRSLYVNFSTNEEYKYIPSDLYYQCLDGSFNNDGDSKWGEENDGEDGGYVDILAEVYIGRASAENQEELANWIYKTISYESNPYAIQRNKAAMVGEYLGFGGVSEYAKNQMEQIRIGGLYDQYATAGFDSEPRIEVDTLYDMDSTWSSSELENMMNSNSYGLFNHLGHANVYYVMQLYNVDVDALTNTSFFFIYSQGCLPGYFPGDAIAEHFTTSTRHGAFAVIFNSRYGWGSRNSTDGPSQRPNRWFWDAIFSEGISQLGPMNVYSHEKNLYEITEPVMRWVIYETNLFGDPHVDISPAIEGMRVAESDPGEYEVVSNQTFDFTVSFTHNYDLDSIDISNIQVNGVNADWYELVDEETVKYIYHNSPVSTEGPQTINIVSGSVLRANDNEPVEEWHTTFYYDTMPLAIATSSPAENETVSSAPEKLILNFNENVDPSTVSVDNITLSYGEITSAVLVDSNTIEYSLAGLLRENTVTYTLRKGSLLDEHGNAAPEYVGTFIIDDPLVDWFESTDIPKNILNQTTVLSTIEVTESFTIGDLYIELDITHSNDTDLDVFLIGPDGTRIELFTDVGENGENFTGTWLDDSAEIKITNGKAPFDGRYKPEGKLSDFIGFNAIGTWTLEVTDDYCRSDEGTLNSWSLIIHRDLNTYPQISSILPLPFDQGQIWKLIDNFTVRFSNEMNPVTVNDCNNWELIEAGQDSLFGTSDDIAFSLNILPSDIDGLNANITIDNGILPVGKYQLTAYSNGLTDISQNPLDGDGDGIAGDNYVLTFNIMPTIDSFPFNEDFETGDIASLGGYWEFEAENITDGQIQVSSSYEVHDHSYHLLLNQTAADSDIQSAILHADLIDRSGVILEFWQREIGGVYDSREDVVQISADGLVWYELIELAEDNSQSYYQHHVIDLDQAVSEAGLSYTSDFQIKFTQYNCHDINGGFAFDDIQLSLIENNDIQVGGHIHSNTTWNDTSRPYTITSDLYIDNDAILTIEPGVQVRVQNSSIEISVSGVLIAKEVNFTDCGNMSNLKSLLTVQNGGRIDFDNNTKIGRYHIILKPGSIGRISKTSFCCNSYLAINSSSVSLSNNTFSGSKPIELPIGTVSELSDNAFTYTGNATAIINGSELVNQAVFQVIGGLNQYQLSQDLTISSTGELVINAGTTVKTEFYGYDISLTVNGILRSNGGVINGCNISLSSGSVGDIKNTLLDMWSCLTIKNSDVTIDNCTFSSSTPIIINLSQLNELTGNSFNCPETASIKILGTSLNESLTIVPMGSVQKYTFNNNLTIESGGQLTVGPGVNLYHNDLTIASGGQLTVRSGGNLYTTSSYLGDIKVYGTLITESDSTIENTDSSNKDIIIESGGKAQFQAGEINGYNIRYCADSTGSISGITFDSGEYLSIYSDAVTVDNNVFSSVNPISILLSKINELSDNTFNYPGEASIKIIGTSLSESLILVPMGSVQKYTFNNLTVDSGGQLTVSSGVNLFYLNDLTIESGGQLTISSGGNLYTTTVSSLGDIKVYGTLITESDSTIENTDSSNKDIIIESGGKAQFQASEINGYNIRYCADSTGSISGITFDSGEYLSIYSDAVTVDNNVFSSVNPISILLSKINELSDNTFNYPGEASIKIIGTSLSESLILVPMGSVQKYTFNNLTVDSGGQLTVSSGVNLFYLNDLTIESGGQLTISSGGNLYTTTVSSLGDIKVYGTLITESDSTIENTDSSNKDIIIESGGKAQFQAGEINGYNIRYCADSTGSISGISFDSGEYLSIYSDAVTVDNNVFSSVNPISILLSKINELSDNTFNYPGEASIKIIGTSLSESLILVPMGSVQKYAFSNNLTIESGGQLIVGSGVNLYTAGSYYSGDIIVYGTLITESDSTIENTYSSNKDIVIKSDGYAQLQAGEIIGYDIIYGPLTLKSFAKYFGSLSDCGESCGDFDGDGDIDSQDLATFVLLLVD